MPRTRNPFPSDTRLVEREQSGRVEAFAAAAVDVATPEGQLYLRSTVGIGKNRHERSWQWVDRIGEVHYAIHRGARVAGYTKLAAHNVNADGTLGPKIQRGLAADIVDMLQSPYGGIRGFVERFFLMMKVPGDAYLIRTRDSAGNPNGYDWLSASEIDTTGLTSAGNKEPIVRAGQAVKRITLPNSTDGALSVPIRAEDFIGRVWRPSGRYIEMADSPMRALDVECELLHILTVGMKSKLLNRLTLNGLLYLPKGIADVRSSAPTGEAGTMHHDKVLDDILRAMTHAVTDPDDPRSAMPIVISGNDDLADKIKLITTDREVFKTDMEMRKELIDRLLMGLDVQPQHVRGLGNSNHWSAWAVSDDERRVSIQPDIETMCWALTRLVLNAEMKSQGRRPGEINKVVIWYDMTGANVKTNLAEDSRQMRDRNLVGEEGARRMSGIDEADAPDDNDRARMIGLDTGNPYLALYGLPIHDTIDWDKVAAFMGKKNGPDQQSAGEPPQSSPGKGAPAKPKSNAKPAEGQASITPIHQAN